MSPVDDTYSIRTGEHGDTVLADKKYKLGYDNPKVEQFAQWIEAAGSQE